MKPTHEQEERVSPSQGSLTNGTDLSLCTSSQQPVLASSHDPHIASVPPSPAAALLDLEVDERGEANHVLQKNESPLQRRLHIQLHPTASEDAQAGLGHIVAMLHLQRAQLWTVLSQDPAKKEITHGLQARTPKYTTHPLLCSQQPGAHNCAMPAPSCGSSTLVVCKKLKGHGLIPDLPSMTCWRICC